MGRIVLSQIARGEIEGVKDYKRKKSEQYNKLMAEADRKIELDHLRNARVYRNATTYLAR